MNLQAVELFAGVGGFRLGIEKAGGEVVWSNQWEPGVQVQYASEIYARNFGELNHTNEDIALQIAKVASGEVSIPDFNLLVGGFPCQDYSVAKSLSSSAGIEGKKGVLWWEIFKLLEMKRPDYVLLENVDRLLVSPAKQRGRDFAIMLRSLTQLDYKVAWKVINAADYGHPQRRKRIFIFATRHIEGNIDIFEDAFPSQKKSDVIEFDLAKDILEISEHFNLEKRKSPFLDSGSALGEKVSTWSSVPLAPSTRTLGSVLLEPQDVPSSFWIDDEDLAKWEYLKGAKSVTRIGKGGFAYTYSEGSMSFPDSKERPARTIVTGEGGRTPSRFKHVVEQAGKIRRLTPIELERLNEFPDDWTALNAAGQPIPDSRRAFIMGNALIVGVVEKLILSLKNTMKFNDDGR